MHLTLYISIDCDFIFQAYQAYPDVSVEYRMKLGQLHTENHNFQTETVNTIYDEIYPQHDLNNLTEKKSSGTLINGLISELLEMVIVFCYQLKMYLGIPATI